MGINLFNHGFDDVPTAVQGNFQKIKPDGYICKVFNAEIVNSKAGNPMLVLYLDIDEGDFKGYFSKLSYRSKPFSSDVKWDNSAIYRQLLFDNNNKVSSYFKGLLTCFLNSNPNINLNLRDFDPISLRGLLIGFIFAEEEYEKRDRSIGTRIVAKFPASIDKIRCHEFQVPELKKLPSKSQDIQNDNDSFAGETVPTFDVPF